jgi:hypothetical protein
MPGCDGAAAAERNVHGEEAAALLEHLAAQVAARCRSRRCRSSGLRRVGLGVGDEVPSALAIFRAGCAASAFITSTLGMRTICVTGAKSFADRVVAAVSRTARGLMACMATAGHADGAGRQAAALATRSTPMPPAPAVFDDHRAERVLHALGEQPCRHINVTTRAKGATMRRVALVWACAGPGQCGVAASDQRGHRSGD